LKGGYSWTELVEISIGIEKKGERFYRAAADDFDQGDIREVLGGLSEDERRHAEVFRGLLPEREETRGIGIDEAMPYIEALVSSGVGSYLETDDLRADGGETLEQVLDFALGFEKETILFYHSLRDLVVGEAESALDGILAEERKHIERINALRSRLGD